MSPIERLQMFTIAARFPRPRAGREQFPRPKDADLACQTMMRSSTVPSFGSEFNDFLHAPIEEDTNGTLLSVLSALARLDVDPWVEASRLAQLPSDIAILELTTLIAPLCDGHPGRRDSKTIVPRLIALLPRRAATDVSHKTLHGVGALHFPRVSVAVLYLVFLVMLLLGQNFIINHQVPPQVYKAPAGTPSTGSMQSTTPKVNR